MKLHRIALCNLNSLYGEQELDLDRGLGEAPLFLVVGPTGAGKSTLLDAICLALFGTTPRLERARSTRVGDEDARRVMSYGTGDCWAEVEFSKLENAERRRYRARWRCTRARSRPDGRLQNPHRSLERRDGDGTWSLLTSDDRKKFYGPHFDRVLEGMTASEFNRAILLAQGDFAAFLKATPGDRAALLERLTDTAIYKDLGSRANLRRQEVEASLRNTRAAAQGIEFLTDEERTKRAARRDELVRTLRDAVRLRDRSREQLTWLRARATWVDRVEQAEAAARGAGEAWAARTEDIERLREHRRCEEAARLLDSATVVSADRAAAEAESAIFEERLAAAAAAVPELARRSAEAARARSEAEDARAALEPILDAARLAAARALDARSEAEDAAREVEAAGTVYERAALARGAAEEAHRRATAAVDDQAARRAGRALAELLGDDPDPGARRRRLTAEAAASRTRASALLRAAEAAERCSEAETRSRDAEEAAREARRRAAAAGARAKAAMDTLAEARRAVADEESLREDLGWTLAVARGRDRLTDGAPCPLCGSSEHDPDSAAHAPEVQERLTAGEARLDRARRRAAQAAADQTAAATGAAEAEGALRAAQGVAQQASEARGRALEALREALAAAELPEDLGPDGIRDAQRSAERRGIELATALDHLEAAREAVARAREGQADAEAAARRTADALAAAKASEAAAAAARAEAAARAGRRRKHADELALARETADEAVRARAGLPDVAELSPDAVEAEVERRLRALREQEDAARQALAAREAAVAGASTGRDSAKRRLEALSERLFTRQDLLARALAELGLPDADALRARRLPAAEADRLDVERTRLAQAAARAGTVLAERTTALQEHDDRAPEGADPDMEPDALAAAIQGFEQRIEMLREELAEHRSALDLDDDHRRRHRDLLAEERRARARAEVWQRLHKLIGIGDGEAFKNFAQILNLSELIGKANHHLARLSERYRLTPALDDEGRPRLSFAVVDRYHADEQRPLTTLSGGETFLVSLSLALALADFRTVRMPIETLLLDEGFGTLDNATLDVAMNALDRLQAGGTQVGIISHVEALKARVPAQVRVEPIGDGRSVIRVQGGGVQTALPLLGDL